MTLKDASQLQDYVDEFPQHVKLIRIYYDGSGREGAILNFAEFSSDEAGRNKLILPVTLPVLQSGTTYVLVRKILKWLDKTILFPLFPKWPKEDSGNGMFVIKRDSGTIEHKHTERIDTDTVSTFIFAAKGDTNTPPSPPQAS